MITRAGEFVTMFDQQPMGSFAVATVADAYLFTVLGWGVHVAVDIGPKLKSYVDRIRARPHVIEAMTAEGLIKK